MQERTKSKQAQIRVHPAAEAHIATLIAHLNKEHPWKKATATEAISFALSEAVRSVVQCGGNVQENG